MTKMYTIQGIEWNEEQVQDYYNCKFCNANVSTIGVYMHEDQFGDYFCEDKECVWEHIAECGRIEVEGITDEGEEE